MLHINKQPTWIYIRIAMIISDLLEAANYCLTSKSANAKYPCHKCLISNEDLANINLTNNQIIYRTHENMKVVIESGTSNFYSIVNLQNSFWKMSDINIYTASVPDRLYHLDIGLFYYQLKYSRMLLKELGGNNAINKMDHRFGTIPPIQWS
ncbi:zn-finger domain-containing protein [Gigaspora margarita]|uniref:Zn-finger domain-containing protein n=1 Tax=Gigaspora margarita TaxID=4874 RepID=A0A8H4ATY8_GIGMA|nr:zn-finger domain-containing protein [Gigaspora margarita]